MRTTLIFRVDINVCERIVSVIVVSVVAGTTSLAGGDFGMGSRFSGGCGIQHDWAVRGQTKH